MLTKTITFQVTDACNLACTYCYQINKGERVMDLETAKKYVDLLLEGCDYISVENSPFLIIEFIGGEPFLEVDLIDKIMDYFILRAVELQHPWATRFCISISSNGTLYFEKNVQKFLNKHRNHLSLSITIDGNKELHDSCRVFPDGRPSYDLAIAGVNDWISRGGYMGSKITICPQNLPMLGEALRHFVGLGYEEINANCVYEEGWTRADATELYKQMKDFADFMLDNSLDIYCSLYEDKFFKPKPNTDLKNWCGGTGQMLSCDPDGYLYPCIRYMESSLGDSIDPIRIGHVDHGIEVTDKEKEWVKCLKCIDRRTQSTDECFDCPIGEGCAWCSAYNYQVYGTPDKRATYICEMHKARSLANVYYWNKRYINEGLNTRFKMHCPKEWAVPIIGEEEYSMLLKLQEV